MTAKENVQRFLREFLEHPEDLAALRTALAAPPATPTGRVEMASDERRSLGAELRARFDAWMRGRDQMATALEAARRRLAEAQADINRLGAEGESATQAYVAWRDPILGRLWAERPTLADTLAGRAEAEASSLRVESFPLPAEDGITLANHVFYQGRLEPTAEIIDSGAEHPTIRMARAVTTTASVEARRKALRGLADEVREWTAKGQYATTADLQRMFDESYATLPPVETLASVMARDERARHYAPRRGRTIPAPAA